MDIKTGHWPRVSKSSMGLSQSLPPMRGGKVRPKTGFCFNVQKRPVPESSGASLVKGLTWRVELRLVTVAENLLVEVSLPVLLTLGGRGLMWIGIPDVLTVHSLIIIFFCYTGWYTSHLLNQWKIITSHRFVLNMSKGPHLQLRYHPPLFCVSRSSILRQLQLIIPLS